jgi:hypothetical protein
MQCCLLWQRARLFVLGALVLFLLVGAGALLIQPLPFAKAQAQSAQNAVPADVQDLLLTMDDVGELKFITPLKLNADQLDKLAQGMAEAQAGYNRKMASLFVPVRKLSDTVREAKKQALVGKTSTDEEQILKTISAVYPKRQAVEEETLKSITALVKQVFTKEQVAQASKMAKDEQTKLTKQTAKGSDEQWLNLYVLRVIMSYPRIVPLLKEMKAAQEAGA